LIPLPILSAKTPQFAGFPSKSLWPRAELAINVSLSHLMRQLRLAASLLAVKHRTVIPYDN
jgi:hypothetical protein